MIGAIWTQGSPRIEETLYWFNLLIDTTLPICGNAAQRPHGQISNDGPKNIVDFVEYIASRVWADGSGRNRAAWSLSRSSRSSPRARSRRSMRGRADMQLTGGHGGIIGSSGHDGPPVLTYLPAAKHTYLSELNITRLPAKVSGVQWVDGKIKQIDVPIKTAKGELLDFAIPKVTIVKDGSYTADDYAEDPNREVDLIAQLADNLTHAPLAGFIVEGLSPYGMMTSMARHKMMLKAVHSGIPVARVGRGNNEGFTPVRDRFIGGRNLTATKARLLLMACLMKFGSLPPAADPDKPTEAELNAIRAKLVAFQAVFDTH